jgi:signal transduction histidine kinase
MLVPVFFVGSFFYAFLFKVLSDQPNTPGFIASSIDPVIKKANLMIILGSIPLFLLLFIWGVIFSHRLVGPLERLQRKLEDMARDGDYKARLSVRKYDYIKPLVESVNKLLDKLAK